MKEKDVHSVPFDYSAVEDAYGKLSPSTASTGACIPCSLASKVTRMLLGLS